jgi:hypothetical protein
MAKYVSLTDRKIATTMGMTLVFKAMEPTEVADKFVSVALQAGVAPAKDVAHLLNKPVTEDSEDEFDDVILSAVIQEIIAIADPDMLTSGGTPKVECVTERTGFLVSAKQIKDCVKSL